MVGTERGVRAVAVQEVFGSQEIVLKDTGAYVEKPAGILGVTVLGDGSIAPVIDLPQLLRGASLQERAAAQLMRDAGYEVRMAIDGMEAAAMIEKNVPDVALVDMEMPRLNGLELTIHLRSREATRSLPIIMITSRSTAKHRAEAQKAGVDVYPTKPFNDDELLQHVERLAMCARFLARR
jgi:CheY-like chemotaxis protein